MAKRVGSQTAVYNSSGITLSDGDETGLFVGADGGLLTRSTITEAGGDYTNDRAIVESRWAYDYNEADADVTASSTSGIFHSLVIGDLNGGGYFIIKDGGSGGTTMAVIVPTSDARSYVYDIPFTTGLYIDVTNTSGAAPMKFVVTYREDA